MVMVGVGPKPGNTRSTPLSIHNRPLANLKWIYLIFGLDKRHDRGWTKVYSCIFTACVLSANAYSQWCRYMEQMTLTGNRFESIVDLLATTSISLSTYVSIAMAFFFNAWLMEYDANLALIDATLPVRKATARDAIYIAGATFSLAVNAIQAGLLLSIAEAYSAVWPLLLLIVNLTTVEYAAYVDSLGARVARLNRRLCKLESEQKCIPVIPKKSPDFVEEVRSMMRVYDKIADNVQIINDTWGLFILLAALNMFVGVLYNVHSIIESIGIRGSISMPERMAHVIWTFQELVPMLFGAVISESFLSECSQTLNIVQKLAVQMQGEERKVLERLALLIDARSVNLSACNFFNYDLSFIKGTLSALVSYIIILIQSGSGSSNHKH